MHIIIELKHWKEINFQDIQKAEKDTEIQPLSKFSNYCNCIFLSNPAFAQTVFDIWHISIFQVY